MVTKLKLLEKTVKNKIFWLISLLFGIVCLLSIAGLFFTAIAIFANWLYTEQLQNTFLIILAILVSVSFAISYLFSKWGGFEWKK